MRPMILVFVTTIVNIVLDLILVRGFSMGAAGAALATVISQLLSMVLALWAVYKSTDFLFYEKGMFRIRKNYLLNLIKIGMPQSIQFTLTNLSFLAVASLVNQYGVNASAVSNTVNKMGSVAVLAAQGVMSAVIVMAGQNIGARNYTRALHGMFMGFIYAIPLTLLFFILTVVCPEAMMGVFTTETTVVTMGVHYLQIVSISYIVESVMFCMFGLMTGAGYTNITMLCAILSSFLVRFGLAFLFSKLIGMGFIGIAWAYPFGPMSSVTVCIIFLLSGKWKISRVKL